MEILKLLIPALIIIVIVVLGLGIGIFFGKKKKFPTTSISGNKEMAKRNITCASHDERQACGLKSGCCGGGKSLD
ncbi:MAG: hypothetical protein RBR97_02035 [Bacteroidales bacterium]|nr:hypothetical protein [Bacteroidales bacterium]